jgi:hypothetical protein
MVYAYERSGQGEDFMVALNAGKSDAEMPLDLAAWGGNVVATDLATGASATWSGATSVKLAGESGRVFLMERVGFSTGTTVTGKTPGAAKPATTTAKHAAKKPAKPGVKRTVKPGVKKPAGTAK